MPKASKSFKKRLRSPVASSTAKAFCTSFTAALRIGSGGKGTARRRGIFRRVRSVSNDPSLSSIVNAANLLAVTPCPVKPIAYATCPRCAVSEKNVVRAEVSMIPPHLKSNLTPTKDGNVSLNCSAKSAKLSGRCSNVSL